MSRGVYSPLGRNHFRHTDSHYFFKASQQHFSTYQRSFCREKSTGQKPARAGNPRHQRALAAGTHWEPTSYQITLTRTLAGQFCLGFLVFFLKKQANNRWLSSTSLPCNTPTHTWGFLLVQTAAVRITVHQNQKKVYPVFLGKKIENSSCLQLISLTKPLVSTFTPSHVAQSFAAAESRKKQSWSRKGGGKGLTKNLNQHATPNVGIFWRLHSALAPQEGQHLLRGSGVHCLITGPLAFSCM